MARPPKMYRRPDRDGWWTTKNGVWHSLGDNETKARKVFMAVHGCDEPPGADMKVADVLDRYLMWSTPAFSHGGKGALCLSPAPCPAAHPAPPILSPTNANKQHLRIIRASSWARWRGDAGDAGDAGDCATFRRLRALQGSAAAQPSSEVRRIKQLLQNRTGVEGCFPVRLISHLIR